MNQDQDNILTMFQTTLDFLDANNAVWNKTPAFVNAVTRAKAGLSAIDDAADKQGLPTTGIAEDKQTLRGNLEAKLLEIADQLSALGASKGDHDLTAQVEMTKSSIDKMDDNKLEQTAERVVGLANANIAELGDYDVVQADVDELGNLRQDFVAKKNAPRVAVTGRKTQTESLPQLIANVRSIFRNEIDKMATKKKTAAPDFYSGYFVAREIVNRPGKRKGPKSDDPKAPTA